MNIIEEFSIKEQRVRNLIEVLEIEGILFKTQSGFSWVTCGGINMVPTNTELGQSSSILITKNNKYLIADNIEAPRLEEEENIKQLGFEVIKYNWFEPNEYALIKKIIPSLNIGCDTIYLDLKNMEDQIRSLRYELTEAEINRYLWLGEKTSEAIESVLMDIKPGWTESQVVAELSKELWKNRIDDGGFQAAADGRAYSFRHPIPKENVIKKHLMLCVMSRKWGLMTTITRMVHFGSISAQLKKQWRDNVYIECAMINLTKPGEKTGQIIKKACKLYDEMGYKNEWMLHNQGGAMGYKAREYGCTKESNEIVQNKQAFCWNPSISGTKSEDGFIVLDNSFAFITKPIYFPVIEFELDNIVYKKPDILEK